MTMLPCLLPLRCHRIYDYLWFSWMGGKRKCKAGVSIGIFLLPTGGGHKATPYEAPRR
jgi:hypothetical protein